MTNSRLAQGRLNSPGTPLYYLRLEDGGGNEKRREEQVTPNRAGPTSLSEYYFNKQEVGRLQVVLETKSGRGGATIKVNSLQKAEAHVQETKERRGETGKGRSDRQKSGREKWLSGK